MLVQLPPVLPRSASTSRLRVDGAPDLRGRRSTAPSPMKTKSSSSICFAPLPSSPATVRFPDCAMLSRGVQLMVQAALLALEYSFLDVVRASFQVIQRA